MHGINIIKKAGRIMKEFYITDDGIRLHAKLDMPEGYKHFSKTKPMKLEHFDDATEWWDAREPIEIDGFDKARKYTIQEIIDNDYNLDLCGIPHEEEEILPPRELIAQYQEERSRLNAQIDETLDEIKRILDIE